MTIFLEGQETQAKVLRALQVWQVGYRRAETIGRYAGMSRQSAAAALRLLADKGLVEHRAFGKGNTRWVITDIGRQSQVR